MSHLKVHLRFYFKKHENCQKMSDAFDDAVDGSFDDAINTFESICASFVISYIEQNKHNC